MPLNRVRRDVAPPPDHSEGGCGNVRKEFSARTKRQAWERANGFCQSCYMPLDRGHHYDHIDPDWFSKDYELQNCQVICRDCHSIKTKRDIKNIAKSKRIINKRIKATTSKRGFRGWRRFDGTLVWK